MKTSEARVYINGLPEDAAFRRAVGAPEAADMSARESLEKRFKSAYAGSPQEAGMGDESIDGAGEWRDNSFVDSSPDGFG